MIPKAKIDTLIAIYLYICDIYENELKFHCERFSNNSNPKFTDQEIMTVYIFAMACEQKFKVKHIHDFASSYLLDWFPQLPGYVGFTKRLNRLSGALSVLSSTLIASLRTAGANLSVSVLDSMPIITCSGKRTAKVAREITDKTYCSTKGIWYYGLKLHVLGFQRSGQIPIPEALVITEASENDLNVFRQNWGGIHNRLFFGDKIYHDQPYFDSLAKHQSSIMYTPVKEVKGQADCLRQRDKAANDLFSAAVSRIRQPIESLFNWLEVRTGIQRASSVRSTNGLLIHIFGRLAVAFMIFFNC
jgi:hypothetical protein